MVNNAAHRSRSSRSGKARAAIERPSMRVKQLSAAQARARGNRPVLPVICHAATRIRFLPAASATPRSTTVPRMIRHSLHRRSDKRFGILDREILSQEIESLDIGRLGDRPFLQGFTSQAIFRTGPPENRGSDPPSREAECSGDDGACSIRRRAADSINCGSHP